MNKIFILFMMAATVAYGQTATMASKTVAGKNAKPVAVKAIAKPEIVDLNLNQREVVACLQMFCGEIEKGASGTPISSLRFYVHRNKVKEWMDYPFVEGDSEISLEWFGRAYKMLDYMAKTRSILENGVANRQTQSEEYKKMQANFYEVYRRFAALLKDPTPVEKKKLEKLREEKRKWELTQKRANAKSGSIKENE